jgi:hypothetical protein
MVTAKKATTPKPATVVAPAPAKPVAVKKSAAKKSVSPAVPAAATALAPAPAKPAAKAKALAKPKAAPAAKAKAALSAEQRNNYVEVAAFYIAERRGFVPGNPADDWIAAEQEVDRLITSGHFNN